MAEGARLESVYTFTGIGGSNPSLSAILKPGLMSKPQSTKPRLSHARVGRGHAILNAVAW